MQNKSLKSNTAFNVKNKIKYIKRLFVHACVRAPRQWRPRPTMQSGKQTWKRQVKTSTQAEQCTRAFPPSSGPFARRIQSHTRRALVTSTVASPRALVRPKLLPIGCESEWLFPCCVLSGFFQLASSLGLVVMAGFWLTANMLTSLSHRCSLVTVVPVAELHSLSLVFCTKLPTPVRHMTKSSFTRASMYYNLCPRAI